MTDTHSDHAFKWALENLVHRPPLDQENPVRDQVVLLNCRKYYATSPFRSLDSMSEIPLETRGDAREEILAKANELGADVIVCGTRGMSPLKRVMIGSVSDYIIHHANCTVIIPRMN
ncbi:hypothetical protein HDU67_004241 [Dinochytrium kinnereticum]|nr:hypothetical protein HDU67_004241 [Dinochytrium kinnereticum]